MSALGANRTGQDGGNANSRLVHRNKTASLFDHLVGAGEECRRDFEAERPPCSQIDDKLEPRSLLDGQISRFRAFENLVHEGSCPTPNVRKIYSVCCETPCFAIFPESDARQLISYRKFCNAFGVGDEQSFVDDRMCLDLRFGLRKSRIQLVETPNLHLLELHIHSLRHFVPSSQDRGHREIVRVHEDTCTIETRYQAFHELQPLRIDLGKEKR